MEHSTLPLIVLGGSDRTAARLPAAARDKHPITGYKAVDVRIRGRAVVEILMERLAASGEFAPVFLAGPERVYRGVNVRAEPIDTDASFGRNIITAMRHVQERFPGSPVAFTTCDILPEISDLRSAMDDWRRHAPADMWYPLVRVPENHGRLGASSWKPTYRVVPLPGDPPEEILPGHLLVANPEAIRQRFIDRLFELGYRTRNRSIPYRMSVMAGGLLGTLLYHDVLHVLSGRFPTLTMDVVGSGVREGLRLRRGSATLRGLEDAVRRIFVKRRHRLRFPEQRVSLPIIDGLSLALDIDTEEEAREHDGTVARG